MRADLAHPYVFCIVVAFLCLFFCTLRLEIIIEYSRMCLVNSTKNKANRIILLLLGMNLCVYYTVLERVRMCASHDEPHGYIFSVNLREAVMLALVVM